MRPAIRNAAALLGALAAWTGAQANGQSSYVVAGIVVDSRSHQPLANARVSLALATARDQKLERVTNRDGRFAFAVSQAGKYSLQMIKPGYPPQAYKHANHPVVSSAIAVREDQDTAHIVFDAVRGSAITGQIRDEDGDPVGNALVAIFRSLVVGGERKVVSRGSTRANAAGEFRLANLPQGSYYVCAMGRPWFADSVIGLQESQQSMHQALRNRSARSTDPDSRRDEETAETPEAEPKYSADPSFRGSAFFTTFYPDAPVVEEASLVRVGAGGEARVAITLRLARAVTVKGTISAPGEMTGGRAALYKKIYDQYMQFLYSPVDHAGGAFAFPNVPPGSYEIVASSEAGSGAASWHIRQEVQVGASDVEVALRPSQMASLAGHIVPQGEIPEPVTALSVFLLNDRGQGYRSGVAADGSFSLLLLVPGRYEIDVGPAEYTAAYLTNSSSEQLPLTLDIPSGDTLQRDLTVIHAASVIDGHAAQGGRPLVGAFVLLMPKDASQRWAYRVDQTDSDGSYHLAAIPSGDYLLAALSTGEDVLYRDPKVAAAIKKIAKPVHVNAGEHLNLDVDVVDAATLSLPSS